MYSEHYASMDDNSSVNTVPYNQDTFLQYLKELQRKFRKLILFLDTAAQHYRSSKVKKHLEESKGVILELNIYPKDHRG